MRHWVRGCPSLEIKGLGHIPSDRGGHWWNSSTSSAFDDKKAIVNLPCFLCISHTSVTSFHKWDCSQYSGPPWHTLLLHECG